KTSSIDIGLHLDQRDWTARHAPVAMEDRIVAVLPALVDQAILVHAAVLDEAIAIAIAAGIDPMQGGLEIGPQPAHGGEITGAIEVGTGEHQAQRRGIDASGVATEMYLTQRGHPAEPHLVQDLAGLGVGLRIEVRR